MSDLPDEALPPYEVPPESFAGVYANFATVGHTVFEFTLDFARYHQQPDGSVKGVLVQRVSMSPLLVSQLLAALTENWATYAQKALPPEVTGQHGPDEADSGPDGGDEPAQ